jgi:hypothetical protein
VTIGLYGSLRKVNVVKFAEALENRHLFRNVLMSDEISGQFANFVTQGSFRKSGPK